MLEVIATEGRCVYLRASGKLDLSDYRRNSPELARILRDRRSRRALIELDGFTGWTLPALLRGLRLLVTHRGRFERLAVKGGSPFLHRAGGLLFRRTPGRVRFFDADEDADARSFVTEGLITWCRPLSAPESTRNDLVDTASEDSFPASDAPGYMPARL